MTQANPQSNNHLENFPKNYDANLYEDNLYAEWENSKAFSPSEAGEPFSIMMPPPNATGVLHLGHSIMLAIQDIIIRHKRMQGYSTLWLPGTDHAGIATQTRVEKNLLEKGISKDDLGREKFLQEVDQFVENSQEIIKKQVRKMGASCDWERERFTLEPHLSKVVNKVFCDMYADGLIYKGPRIVNWDPVTQTAIADDEVEYKPVKAKLYYIKYGPLEIATSRPETKLGDTAVAVHPDDKRYAHLVGQTLDINFGDHKITVKVIADKSIDPEYGTGALGVTPAHSFVDYELAQKHNVPVLQVIDNKGKMTEVAGKYQGLTVLEAREAFVQDLDELGLLIKTEEYTQNLSISYRSGATIEPLISEQWFIDVNKKVIDWEGKKLSLREVALEVVQSDKIKLIPSEFTKVYLHWIENLHDWCISRQLWYGHQIPAWYNQETSEIKVQPDSPELEFPDQTWTRDPDTLDTWFSSGLWTFSTLGWPEDPRGDFKKFHPTNLLETGHDILPFWIARMILLTTYITKEIPFKEVYLHGLIRDRQGRKMSKSLGNGIDPLDMIEKYGTDALRLSLTIGNTPGNDLKIYEEKIEGFRNFITKLWNASKFSLSHIENPTYTPQADFINSTQALSLSDKWILNKLQSIIQETTEQLNQYKISEAGNLLYDFLWNDYANWYLEFSKQEPNPSVLNYTLQKILVLLHPFIPFVTEQLWKSFKAPNLLITESWPLVDQNLIFEEASQLELIRESIQAIRADKASFGLASKTDIKVTILTDSHQEVIISENKSLLEKLAKIQITTISTDLDQNIPQASLAIINPSLKIFTHLDGQIDFAGEIGKTKKEIDSTTKLKQNLEKRLANKNYVESAPEHVVNETKHNLTETLQKLSELEKRLNLLQN